MSLSLVPGADVVKGLNTLSAWALQNGLLAGKQVKRGEREYVQSCGWDQGGSLSDVRKALQRQISNRRGDYPPDLFMLEICSASDRSGPNCLPYFLDYIWDEQRSGLLAIVLQLFCI